jgi:signal transduction histidine kinase/ActR/RegA family two-component response regulator
MRRLLAHGIGIRSYLLTLALAALIPLGLLAAILLYLVWTHQQAEVERGAAETARALSAALENHLDSSFKRLAVLSNETALVRGDVQTFAQRCREAVDGSADWHAVLMAAPDGKQLVNTLVGSVAGAPDALGLPYIREAVETGQRVVSGMFIGRISGEPLIGVALPVRRDGELRYVLSAGLNLEFFRELISRSGHEGAASALLDQDLAYIARSRGFDQRAGEQPPPALRAALRSEPMGVTRYTTEEGWEALAAWSRVPHAEWTVLVAIPVAARTASLAGYLTVLGGIWLLLTIGGALAATYVARRIAADVRGLAKDAEGLAEGRVASPQRSAITELRALGAAHQRTAQRLDELLVREREHRERAQAENKSKDEFIAMLGHELRNPLGAISNAARVLLMPERNDASVRFAADVIARQSQQLRRLVDDLLDVNRIISGKISLDRKPIDLATTVDHVLATLGTAGRTREHIVTADTRPVWIEADPARVEQVVTNLITNAIAYTPVGGKIHVEVERSGDAAILRVIDTGVGIAPSHLASVFDLFYQAPQELDRARGGLGIGLTLVQRIVELHGGTVRAHSEGVGKGATFTVELPAARAPLLEIVSEQQPRATHGLKILLIEDDADSRETLRQALQLNGHRVEVAQDGPSGLSRIASFKPDVAIVDIGLPGMSGYQVAEAIRSQHGRELMLVALTGYGRREDEQLAKKAGFDRHIVKPADFPRLLGILASAEVRGARRA